LKQLFRSPNRADDPKRVFSERLCVLVLSSCSGAGASYVSSQILKNGLFNHYTPAGTRTLVELGKPHFYDALGMDKRFCSREFYDFESGGKIMLNMEMGYNWYLRRNSQKLDDTILFKMAAMAPGNLIVFDASFCMENEAIFKLMPEMDIVYLVIDPFPSKLLSSWEYIKKVKEKCPKAIFVVNKFNKGIHKGQLASFLGTQNYYEVNEVSLEYLCKCEYNCNLP